jgi:hypothetical protein
MSTWHRIHDKGYISLLSWCFRKKAIIFSFNVTLVAIRNYDAYLLTWVGYKNNSSYY